MESSTSTYLLTSEDVMTSQALFYCVSTFSKSLNDYMCFILTDRKQIYGDVIGVAEMLNFSFKIKKIVTKETRVYLTNL